MLCQFSFQNFKSYKDETTFDFRAMAIPEFQDALIRQEKAEDLLPVSAVYGPNGGGKTNLLQAFFCLINLVVKPIHALEKNRQPMIFQQGISKASINLDVNPKMPYLSFLAINYNIPVIAEVQNWFESCITQSYANPRAENIVLVSKSETTKESLIHALNDVGIDLSGYRYDEDSKHLFTQRTINGKVYELPFEAESDGTKKMIAALPVLMVALQEGRTVVVDELDAKLHPKLLRYVIQMFKNPELNKKGAQLLFSSHDLTTMKNTVFRRDEIWFAAMNDNHESEIYSLYEFRQEDNTRVKSTAAFDKQYLEGRYGADQCVSVFEGSGKW